VAMEEDHPVPPEEVQAVVVLLWEAQVVDVLQWEAQAQEVDVLQWEAQAQEVDVLRWEAQAVAQEVDVHPLEVLEADHQEVGLEIVQEAQEVAQELEATPTSTHRLMPTTKQWQKLPKISQGPQPHACHALQDAPATAQTTLATLTTVRLSQAAQEV